MKVLTAVALLATLLYSAPARAADDLSYDDPGMHYKAPDGWQKVPISPEAAGQEGVPKAAFVEVSGKRIVRSLTITIADFDGSLDDFTTAHTQLLRQPMTQSGPSGGQGGQGGQNNDDQPTASNYIEKRISTKTTNGMPALELIWTATPAMGTQTKNYEYLMIDGTRSIDVRYAGDVGDVGDADAVTAFSTLYVVAYPHPRRTE